VNICRAYPWSSVTLVSKRSPAELGNNIERFAAVHEARWRFLRTRAKIRIVRRSRWTSARAIGSVFVTPDPDGSRVTVKIRLPFMVIAVLAASVALGPFATALSVHDRQPGALWLWIVPLFGWASVTAMFQWDAERIVSLVRELAT